MSSVGIQSETRDTNKRVLCLTDSKSSGFEAGGPSDPGQTERGRGPRQSSGVQQDSAELRQEDDVAEEFRQSFPERNHQETSPNCSETAGGPGPKEERQVRLAHHSQLLEYFTESFPLRLLHTSTASQR